MSTWLRRTISTMVSYTHCVNACCYYSETCVLFDRVIIVVTLVRSFGVIFRLVVRATIYTCKSASLRCELNAVFCLELARRVRENGSELRLNILIGSCSCKMAMLSWWIWRSCDCMSRTLICFMQNVCMKLWKYWCSFVDLIYRSFCPLMSALPISRVGFHFLPHDISVIGWAIVGYPRGQSSCRGGVATSTSVLHLRCACLLPIFMVCCSCTYFVRLKFVYVHRMNFRLHWANDISLVTRPVFIAVYVGTLLCIGTKRVHYSVFTANIQVTIDLLFQRRRHLDNKFCSVMHAHGKCVAILIPSFH